MRTLVAAMFVTACAASASAQNLALEFSDGKVSIDATAVPVRTILAEWARLGGTRVVGAEKVTGAPLTIKLEKMPEAQALAIVLRNVAGYMAALRPASATGASAYDRILVMATSTTPPPAAAAAGRGAAGTNAGQRGRAPFAPPQQPADVENAVAADDPADTGVNEPAFQFPQQNPFQNAVGQPGPFGTPMPPGAQPPVFQFGGAQQGGVTVNPSPQQPMPALQFPGMPQPGAAVNPGGFGIGSQMPGVIVQPAQPGQPQRPPGGM
jgi:hypothetical protein